MRKLERKPLTWFRPQKQVREQFDEAEDRRLGESLRQVGQIQPVVARPDGSLLAGERRLRGAKLAGLPELDVVITDEELTHAEIIAIQISENEHRAALSDQEKAKACEELLALKPDLDQRRLAELLNVDAPTICKWLSPRSDRVIPEVRAAFLAGKIGFKATYPISQAPPEQQAGLLSMALAGATREQLQGRVKQAKSQQKPNAVQKPAGPRRATAILSSGRSVTVSGSNLDLEGFIGLLEDCLQRARKARPTGVALSTFLRMLKDQGTSTESL